MEENNDTGDFITEDYREQEIDLLKLARKVWDSRRFLLKWSVIGAIAGIIIGFSIPKEYVATIRLISEGSGSQGVSSGLSALANMAGMSVGSRPGNEAVSPQLYPDIVKSVPFTLELLNVNVSKKKSKETMTVREYVTKDLSVPWWTTVMSIPGRIIGSFSDDSSDMTTTVNLGTDSPSDTTGAVSTIPRNNQLNLTPGEIGLLRGIASRISAELDPRTSIISINVTMQDPKVATILADTVAEKLKEYVTAYRTNKARKDLENTWKLNEEAKAEYYKAQQNYASYVDKNQGITLRSMRTEEERLQNEMQLAYALYNTTAQQLQVAKAKVQEITPVYTILEPATVPTLPSKPSKMIIIIGCIFVAFAGAAGWVLFGKDLISQFKETKTDTTQN